MVPMSSTWSEAMNWYRAILHGGGAGDLAATMWVWFMLRSASSTVPPMVRLVHPDLWGSEIKCLGSPHRRLQRSCSKEGLALLVGPPDLAEMAGFRLEPGRVSQKSHSCGSIPQHWLEWERQAPPPWSLGSSCL